MKRACSRATGTWTWAYVLMLWALAAALAGGLTGDPLYRGHGGGSLATRILGRGAAAASEYLIYDMADRTFHGGRSHFREASFQDDIFQTLRRQIAPAGHVHLQGEKLKEIMPWFLFGIWLDPENEEYSLIASYWLAQTSGPQAALKVLLEAQVRNPSSYLVQLGKARIYAKGDHRDPARRVLDNALKLWPGRKARDDKDALADKREILSYRSVLYELDDDAAAAIGCMREIVAICPSNTTIHIAERMAVLSRGGQPQPAAAERWNSIRREEYYHLCEDEADESSRNSTPEIR